MIDPLPRAIRTERYDLGALQETGRLLATSLELDFILGNLLLTSMSKVLVTRGAVLLHDPLMDAYRVAAQRGMNGVQVGDILLRGLVDLGSGRQGEEVPEALAGHRLALALPIRFGSRDVGIMALGGKLGGTAFSEEELGFLRTLVGMTAPAIQNSIVVGELKQANRDLDGKIQQLETLFDLAQEFNSTTDREKLARLLSLTLMGQMMAARHLFFVQRPDRPGREGFVALASRGIRPEDVGEELTGRLCEIEGLVLLTDDDTPSHWADLADHGLVLAFPLKQQGQTCGVLCLGPKGTGQPYTPDDVEMLYAIGNLALTGIRNSFLLEEQMEKRRLEEEMRLARSIQVQLLPQRLPTFEGVDLAAIALPSREVGGDYYDVARLDAHRLLVAVADVTGKGAGAALLMSNLQAALHALVPMPLNIEETVGHINRVICENTGADKFITFFIGVYDVRTGTFEYVNAGHNPPMLLRAGGALELLETGGLLLGVMAGMPYDRGTVTLGSGDTLVLFTDGVTEAMSPVEEEFGEDRLEAVLREAQGQPAQAQMDRMVARVSEFTEGHPSGSDDLTAVFLHII